MATRFRFCPIDSSGIPEEEGSGIACWRLLVLRVIARFACRVIAGTITVFSLCPCALAEPTNALSDTPSASTPAPSSSPTNGQAKLQLKVEEISPGVFKLGNVRFSKEKRWVELPCQVEKREGELEYLLVGPGGKRHESLLSTDVDATILHTVMLLLGIKNSLDAANGIARSPERIDAEYLRNAPQLQGAAIRLELQWAPPDAPGQVRTAPAGDWIMRSDLGVSMPPGMWLYTGSLFIDGTFMARLEQSFVALVTDPSALINNPGEGHDKDRIWRPNAGNVPPLGTAVTLHIALDEPAPAMPASSRQPDARK